MNSTVDNGIKAEEMARRELDLMNPPGAVTVEVKVRWMGGICLPDEDGDEVEKATWKVLTVGDNWIMDKACSYDAPRPDGQTQPETDYNEMRRLMVKRNLLGWSLDIPIERENGWMRPECYARVSRVIGPLLEAFVLGFEDKSRVTQDEERQVDIQSAALFGGRGGVADACEAVSLFCTLGNYWDKFGFDKDSLAELPFREYTLLKMMISRENRSIKSKPKGGHDRPTCKVVGPGGKVGPSRGIMVPM
jgi:hypothetical protein